MIKFKASKDDKELIGFGLSEENVRKLKDGMPIHIDDSDLSDQEILIFYGKTEKDMMDSIYRMGIIGSDTKIKTGNKR